MTGEGLREGKVRILCSLSHLGPFCLQVNSLNWILPLKRWIDIEWKRILCSLSRLGPICFILFSSQLFDKDDVFCIELNRIGRSYHKIGVIFEQYQHLLSFFVSLVPSLNLLIEPRDKRDIVQALLAQFPKKYCWGSWNQTTLISVQSIYYPKWPFVVQSLFKYLTKSLQLGKVTNWDAH